MDSDVNLKVLQCVDAGLDSLGKASSVVYWYLTQKSGLERDSIPDDPKVFVEALKTLFGQGAEILERVIVREMEQAFKITTKGRLVEALSVLREKSQPSSTSPTEARNSHEPHISQPTSQRIRSRKTG